MERRDHVCLTHWLYMITNAYKLLIMGIRQVIMKKTFVRIEFSIVGSH